MKSAFCPVIRNNSPPARRQHIAKVCYFPIGTRLNSRQSRKPRPITRQPVFPTKPEVRPPLPEPETNPLFGSRPSAPYRSRKPTAPQSRKPDRPLLEPETDRPAKQKARSSNRTGSPFSEARPLLPEPETHPLFGNSSFSLWFPRQSRKTIWRPAGTIIFFLCDSLIFRAREAGFRRF